MLELALIAWRVEQDVGTSVFDWSMALAATDGITSVDGCDDAPKSRRSSTALQDFWLTSPTTLLLLTVSSRSFIGIKPSVPLDLSLPTASPVSTFNANTRLLRHLVEVLLVVADTTIERGSIASSSAVGFSSSSPLSIIQLRTVRIRASLSRILSRGEHNIPFVRIPRSTTGTLNPSQVFERADVLETDAVYSRKRRRKSTAPCKNGARMRAPSRVFPSTGLEPRRGARRPTLLKTISSHHLVNVLKTISHQDLLNLFKTVSSQPPRDHPTTTSSTSSRPSPGNRLLLNTPRGPSTTPTQPPPRPDHHLRPSPTAPAAFYSRMSTISTALRNFKEPTKEQLTEIFFSLPPTPTPAPSSNGKDSPTEDVERMDINAVLSLGIQGEEDSYAGKLYLLAPYLAFASLDRKSRIDCATDLPAPTADLFCSLLRDALKIELQRGQMKAVKGFVKTCYSETLISAASSVADGEREGR
ncbi:hypothetical protein BDZ89DRAFT_1044110 [Hymenopellis radicata]|nr:hypothetical protein BDZ89DRAFT_1044110 [Hymenopellis radicata]